MNTLTQATPASTTQPASTAELIWIRLMRVYQQLHHASAEIAQSQGMSISRFDVLNHAAVRDGRSQQELADALFVTKGNITQLLDGLAATGCLTRTRDGRTNRVMLTELGRNVRATILSEQQAMLSDRVGAALTSDEQATLHHLLVKLDRGLR